MEKYGDLSRWRGDPVLEDDKQPCPYHCFLRKSAVEKKESNGVALIKMYQYVVSLLCLCGQCSSEVSKRVDNETERKYWEVVWDM